MDELTSLSATEITLGVTAVIALIAFVVFIAAPSWSSYGRLWERMAASFLSLYIGAAVLGVGIAVGVGLVALWVQFASG
jgi:uncharacterized membrane-anchored protein YitT (DUF2179 family)